MKILIGSLFTALLFAQTIIPNGQGGGGGGAVASVSGSTGVTCTPTTGAVVCSLDTTVAATRTNTQANQDNVISDSTGSDTYACTLAASGLAIPTFGASTVGSLWQLVPTTGNTGAATCQGLSIVRSDGSALTTGDIVVSKANFLYQYDSATLRRVAAAVSSTASIYLPTAGVFQSIATVPLTNGGSGTGAAVTDVADGGGGFGDYGILMSAGTTQLLAVVFLNTTGRTLTTLTVKPVAALRVRVSGTGTYVLQFRAACVAIGADLRSPSYGSYTAAGSGTVISAAGSLAGDSYTVTPGGTCSDNSLVVLQARRDTVVNAATDTAVDGIILIGTTVEY